MLTIDKFYNARIVLENILRKTDLVHTKKVNTTCEVYLKPECLQRTGSFKIRGAYYKISQLSDEEKAKGVVACSAGNHAQGVAYAAKTLNPNIKVYGVQAENAASMVQSLEAKEPVLLTSVSTLADGIAVKKPGDITFDICSNYVDGVVTVSEEEICAAILRLIEKKKMVAEGAGAVAVAAVMFDKIPVEGKKVVCLVSGGNIDVTTLGRVISSGLIASGRLCSIHIEVNDQPGTLAQTCAIVSKLGANIISVHHDRAMSKGNVRVCVVKLTAETRNEEHLLEIKSTLKKKGFNVVND